MTDAEPDLDRRLDTLQGVVQALVARRRWQAVNDDPELKKVLVLILERLGDVRRMRATSPRGRDADAELGQIAAATRGQLRERDFAWVVADALKFALVRIGTDAYVRERLREARAPDGPDVPGAGAVEYLLSAYARRADAARHREARRRVKARYLLHLGLLLGVLVPCFVVVAQVATDLSWWTVLAVSLAGAVGATVSGVRRLRDELSSIEDLRTFRPAIAVQPLVGAALALVVALLLKAGLLGLDLPAGDAQTHALAVFGFVAGFSEPFVVGLVGRVAALADERPAGG